jgi:exodeoxyribonuclease VII large subunit
MLERCDKYPAEDEGNGVFTVSELSDAIRQSLESEFPLVRVIGEITNFTAHSSGHFYLTLRDETCRLGVVIFSRNTANVDFPPENGMTAVACGRISHYGGGGRTQLIAVSLRKAGEGELELNKRRLLAKLRDEGLTDPGIKKEIPRYPGRIAVITSPEGAAINDIRRTLARRWPLAETILLPAAVQGADAGSSISEAFKQLEGMAGIDVVILARGGGSAEDLWTFNTEGVARAVARCMFPVVTGIGHEIDTTVCDYVADLSSATPTAAAEVVTPDSSDVRRGLDLLLEKIASLCSEDARQRLERIEFMMRSSAFPAIEYLLDRSRLEVDDRIARIGKWLDGVLKSGRSGTDDLESVLKTLAPELIRDAEGLLARLSERIAGLSPAGCARVNRERLEMLVNKARMITEGDASYIRSDLEAKVRAMKNLGPREVLGRGYTYCTGIDAGTIIGSVDELEEGARISVNFFDGIAGCLVESRRKDAEWPRR